MLAPIHHALSDWAETLLLCGAAGWAVSRFLPSVAAVRLRASLAGRAGLGQRISRASTAARARLDSALGRHLEYRRRAVIALCRTLASELRAGRPPAAALDSAVAELDPAARAELGPLVAAAHATDDLQAALGSAATRPGMIGLGYLAACWRLASDSGAGLAGIVDGLADSLADDESRRQELSAQLAGPRATALLLAALPALGLAMAGSLGTSPLTFLFTTPAGLACLVTGLALDGLGLWWIRGMARRALTPRPAPRREAAW